VVQWCTYELMMQETYAPPRSGPAFLMAAHMHFAGRLITSAAAVGVEDKPSVSRGHTLGVRQVLQAVPTDCRRFHGALALMGRRSGTLRPGPCR